MAVVAPRSEDVENPSSFFRAYNTRSGEEDYVEVMLTMKVIGWVSIINPHSVSYETLRGDTTKAYSLEQF